MPTAVTSAVPLEAALAYRARGWCVVPAAARGKRPKIAWERFQQQLATVEEIQGWFGRWPDANVAIVTGEVSGLVVIDVDPRHGGDDSLAGLESRWGPLPITVAALTGGGGRHLYFRHPGIVTRNQVGIAPGLDLRGDGGIIIAPPSLHPSGQHYRWLEGQDPESRALAALPAWLLQQLGGDGIPRGHPLSYWRDLVRNGVTQGQRNNTIASLTGHLLWHGVDLDIVTDLLLSWNRDRCRPPLCDAEVVRTVESVARTHARHAGDDEPGPA